jgi:hypothetical protein
MRTAVKISLLVLISSENAWLEGGTVLRLSEDSASRQGLGNRFDLRDGAYSLARCKASSSHISQFRQRFEDTPSESGGKSNGTVGYIVLAARSEVMLSLFNNQTQQV